MADGGEVASFDSLGGVVLAVFGLGASGGCLVRACLDGCFGCGCRNGETQAPLRGRLETRRVSAGTTGWVYRICYKVRYVRQTRATISGVHLLLPSGATLIVSHPETHFEET